MESKLKQYMLVDLFLIIIVGIIMVYSSSYIYAKEVIGSSTYFLFKQLIFLILGGIVAYVISKTKFSFWYRNSYKLNTIATFLLLFTLTPLGVSIKGSNRWLNILGLNLQPGEFVKYTIVFSAIYFFNNYKKYSRNDLILYSMQLLVPLTILIVQPDFGTFTISAILIAFACFLSDFSRKYFYSAICVGAIAISGILVSAPYRVKRLLTFLDPWGDPQNSGFQIIQSYLAFANGHIFGQGIGNSNEKLFYLPEAYNDFIFSVLGEEIGLIGVICVVALYTVFVFLGFKLALTVKSKINASFIATIIFAIGFQAFLNMGVVLGLLPTKGLNLPFISYGGSSLFANLVGIGFVFSALAVKSQIMHESDSIHKSYTIR
ncbi:MAG: putative lipid II flippase FtsW [Bacteriovoracaceae bacterium]|jgi:cell division protein FtsW|nr:putative lipid II flippase FtsW [Bacteriovoracaceae bacterium]